MLDKKPDIRTWVEGLVDYYNAKFPYPEDDPRRVGFYIGCQIIGLHAVEVLLQYALDKRRIQYCESSPNLLDLFLRLPEQDRQRVETKYEELLHGHVKETWDYKQSVESFLRHLGKRPITDARYFWRSDRQAYRPMLFGRAELYHLIYALFIVLHNYPSKQIVRKYETKFISLEDSLRGSKKR